MVMNMGAFTKGQQEQPEEGLAESIRMAEDSRRERNWKRWGPYLPERQWGTVREDYSRSGTSWDYFPHDHARSRVYRWGEDGPRHQERSAAQGADCSPFPPGNGLNGYCNTCSTSANSFRLMGSGRFRQSTVSIPSSCTLATPSCAPITLPENPLPLFSVATRIGVAPCGFRSTISWSKLFSATTTFMVTVLLWRYRSAR